MIYRDEECSDQPSAIVAHELLSRRTVRKWTTGPAWPGGGPPRYASVLVKGFALTALSVSGQPAASFDSRTQWSCPARASGTVSEEWTWSSVKQLVDQKTNHGWEFVFVAGNIDAEVAGGQIGIHHTLSFAMMNADTTPLAYQALSQAADSFRRTGAIDQTLAVDPDSRDKSGS